jgi:hypothetical protein
MTLENPNVRRDTIKRYIEGRDLLVVVEVPVIYAEEEPDEPLLEAETIRWLDEVTRRAKAGDRTWLASVGRLYELASKSAPGG